MNAKQIEIFNLLCKIFSAEFIAMEKFDDRELRKIRRKIAEEFNVLDCSDEDWYPIESLVYGILHRLGELK